MGSINEQIQDMDQRLMTMENRFADLGYDFKRMVVSEIKQRWKFIPQDEMYFGLYTALCVDTADPLMQGRVRFFSPMFNRLDAQVPELDWAVPISTMGGFDDSGLTWVPPAGSKLCIVFERGSRSSPYYIGTTWDRDRGPDGQLWNFSVPEYQELYAGHRLGYLIPPNDGSQVMPSWNTDSYEDIDQPKLIGKPKTNDVQPPNQYGFKTQQKHMWKAVDGNKRKDYRYKRLELYSSCGNWMLFKDDPMNKDEWANPQCEGKNEYFKHENECRPYRGPGTPQNNKSALWNTGIQLLSISGHTIIMDDKIKGEGQIPQWERSKEPFDFGDLYEGKMKLISTTGHRIEFSDKEDIPENRGPKNYLRMLTACGNTVELNDHTTPAGKAGDQRGVHIWSTSRHRIEMIDEDNEQKSPPRMEINRPPEEPEAEIGREERPINKATKAFIRIRTGYGLEIMMGDDNSQQETQNQYIQIYCPFVTCPECGPHIMRFQEKCNAEGYVFLKVAGYYLCITCKDHTTIVGDPNQFPSDWITIVSKDSLIKTEEYYLNLAKIHFFMADEYGFYLAGKDCTDKNGDCCPCIDPVLCYDPIRGAIVISDRIFVSASKKAPVAPIFLMYPFVDPPPEPSCDEKGE